MIEGIRFHHIGVACRRLEHEVTHFLQLGYHQEGEDFADPIQKIRGCFLVGGGPRLEILEPWGDNSPLEPWLKKGVKLYHTAYETASLAHSLEQAKSIRARVIVPPVAAVAFGGRKIAFVMLPNMLCLEFIESK